MWLNYVFVLFTLFSVSGTVQIKNMEFGTKDTVNGSYGNSTNDNLVSNIKQIIEVRINGKGVGYNNIKYDHGYASFTANITSKYKMYESGLDVQGRLVDNQTVFIGKRVTAGNQTNMESIDNTRITMTNCCVINKQDNFTAQIKEQHSADNVVNNNTIAADAVVYDKKNKSTGRMEVEAAFIPVATRPIRDGTLSDKQHDRYVEIIKAVKCALNVIAVFVTLMSVLAFSRTKHSNSSTTFIVGVNIFGFVAALLSIAGYTMSFSLGTASEIYLIYTQYVNMYVGAVCRRIVYLLNMLMSGQRFAVIALPFLARRKFRTSINVVIIVVVVVTTFATHAYVPFCYIVVPRGGEVFSLGYSPLYKNNSDSFETASSATKFLFAFLPLMASLLANGLLLAYLKHHARTTKNLRIAPKIDEAFSRQNRQVTLIVLVSSVSFTLFSFPANIHLLTTSYTTEYGYNQKEHYLFMVVHEALLGLLTLGDIANFLSYLFLSSAFRGQFCAVFKTSTMLRAQRPASIASQAKSASSLSTVTTVARRSESATHMSE